MTPEAPDQQQARKEAAQRICDSRPMRCGHCADCGRVALPGSQAVIQANLGALAQARAELSVYQWPAWPIQDALRRSPEVDLAPAIAHYQAALALDPRNVAANRRLGQIELSDGQYDAARQHLEAAFAAAPGQRERDKCWARAMPSPGTWHAPHHSGRQ